MNDIAIRVENCILSRVEGLSKLYPAVAPRACPESSEGARHLGRAQQRHDTPSTRLRTRLRDALVTTFKRSNVAAFRRSLGRSRMSPSTSSRARSSAHLLRLPAGQVQGVPSTELRTGIGRNGAGTLAPALRRQPYPAQPGMQVNRRSFRLPIADRRSGQG